MDTATFRTELRAQMDRAHRHGAAHVEINARKLHRSLGGYPGTNHRMPICSQVMHAERGPADEIITSPELGKGATLTIRYQLPRPT